MNRSWDDDGDPLAALRAGDPVPFEEFVRAEATTLFAFFQRLGADLHEAEDLTQDVFVKLYRTADRYAPSERFTAFCFRVARNAWIDRRRRVALRPRALGQGGAEDDSRRAPGEAVVRSEELGGVRREPAPSIPDALSVAEDARRLRRALAELSEHHRVVFELGALQELSYAEVGSLLDVPVGTVKSRMFYALRRLRDLLAPGDQPARLGGGARPEEGAG